MFALLIYMCCSGVGIGGLRVVIATAPNFEFAFNCLVRCQLEFVHIPMELAIGFVVCEVWFCQFPAGSFTPPNLNFALVV